MKLSREHSRIVRDALSAWEREQVLDAGTAGRLRNNLEPAAVNWRRISLSAFGVAGVFALCAVGAALADNWLMAMLERLLRLPWSVKTAVCALLAAAIFLLGAQRRRLHPEKAWSNEGIYFAGVLAVGCAVACLGRAIDPGSGNFPRLILLAAGVYGGLGLALESKLVWTCALLALGGGYAAETGFVADWAPHWLGLGYPLRFVPFGAAVTLGSLLLRNRWRAGFFGLTRTIGLFYFFNSLWALSIFGNYESEKAWHAATHLQLLPWALVSAAAALAGWWWGARRNDNVLRAFGLTYLLLNLYSRYWEYAWDVLPAAVFFTLLAVSFWLLGAHAERLWHLRPSVGKPPENQPHPA